ncbi:hypothetical protein VOM14_06025 [Paraburkholderia sp. MPAMCS5]|uniref:phage protein n=1 Tax=Paraburkholderia sp. MPAMCS5 TaxID=3112563 RepID=UPI002E1772C7|nr:hypothetical protein [Paraburkholderia sp. MPAMCS5]
MTVPKSALWGRKATLVVSTGTIGLDLSELRFTFKTSNSDAQTPNTLYVRIYNLSPHTVAKIGTYGRAEFSTITLQAGYGNSYGIIFSGTIKQTAKGRERNVDNYLDVWAADGDSFYNFSAISVSLAAGHTPQQVVNAIVNTPSINGTPPVKFAQDVDGLIVGVGPGLKRSLSRGKAIFGLPRDYLRDWADKYGYRWSIQNGEFVVVPITGYRPGEAVVLSPDTGLVGVPEACDGGVRARALLNPKIRIGCLVRIAQGDINHITQQQFGLTAPNTLPSATLATVAGMYRVMTAEFTGDTRGNEWYVDLICLAVDASAPDQSQSVAVAA